MKQKFLFAATLMSLVFASCGEKDLFDPEWNEAIKTAEYETNFIKKYGKVDPNQNWDLTTGAPVVATRAAEDITISPVAGLNFAVDNKTERTGRGSTNNPYKYSLKSSTTTKNNALYQNIGSMLPDGEKHEGKEAVLTAPSNSFMIYPVMGQGAFTYDLYVKVGDQEEVKVFTKNWTVFDKPYVNGMAYAIESSTGKLSLASMPGVVISAPVGTPIEVYLKNIKNGGSVVTDKPVGTCSGNAIFVDATEKPEGLGSELTVDIADAVVKYIGIEDNINGGDRDYNDLVLAIVGNPYVPQPIVIEEDEYTLPIAQPAKRYMIEDLGSTDDFDFNDVVVDVMDIVEGKYKVTRTNGVITNTELVETTHKQTATVRHLGGTIPFTLKIGDTTLEKMQGELDVDKEDTYDIEGWIPTENNITCTAVYGTNDDVKSITIGFPKKGEVPMIIATDLYRQWMPERQSIPETWWKK